MEIKSAQKFLYIVESFPPLARINGIRAFEFSKRLFYNQFYPIILTRSNIKGKLVNYASKKDIPTSFKIYRTHSFELKNDYIIFLINNFFRPDFYIDWIPFAYIKAKNILKRNKNIQFLYASGPLFSALIIGYLLKKKFNLPLIIEYQDPWSYNPYLKENEQMLNKKIDLFLEKKILKSADLIVTVSTALNCFLRTKFPFINGKPLYSIPNGLNINDISKTIQKEKTEILFTFTGNLYGKRDISPLLKIVSELKRENFFKDFNLKIQIFGTYKKSELENIIKKLHIENQVFLGSYIPIFQVYQEIKNSDLAIHIGENMDYPTISFKVWDYLSCNKKILYLGREDSFTSQFLKENDLGIIIPLNNLERGKVILKELLTDISKNSFNNEIGKEKILEFTWEKRGEILLNIIKKHIIK